MNYLSGKHILLGVTGGIAAYKSAELVRQLREQGADVRVVMGLAPVGVGFRVPGSHVRALPLPASPPATGKCAPRAGRGQLRRRPRTDNVRHGDTETQTS